MKRKTLAIFLTMILAGTILSACGNATEETAMETATETQEEASSEESGAQEEENSAMEETADEQQNMLTVYLPVKCTLFLAYDESETPEFSGRTEYEYDDYGNLIKSTEYLWDENTISDLVEVEYEYDDAGRIAKETSYNTSYDDAGNVEGDKTKIGETEYEYNENGMLLKSIKTEYFELEEWELADMDPEILIEKRVTESEYDEYGNAVKENLLDSHPGGSEDTYEFTYEYEYDGNGQMVQATKSRNDDAVKVVRVYDEHGNKTEEYQVVPDDSGLTPVWAKCEYTYDEQGRVIETLNHTDMNELLEQERFPAKYEYDANNNIIKVLEENGQIITEYEYIEMQIPDIKNSYKENKLIEFSIHYCW